MKNMNDQMPLPDAPQPTSPDLTTTPTEPTAPSQPTYHETVLTKPGLNKRAIFYIISLFIIGIVAGLILSNVFINETNNIIQQINDQFDNPFLPPGQNPYFQQNLTTEQIILPTFGVVIVCISVLLLIGVIAVYFKIVLKTKSRYIIGLLIFLIPLLAETIVSISALRNLFVSAAIPYVRIRESIGFGFGGFGSVLVIVSVFEIIGLTMLLYISQE